MQQRICQNRRDGEHLGVQVSKGKNPEPDEPLTLFSSFNGTSLQKSGLLLGLLGFAGMSRSRWRGDGSRLKIEDGV